MDRVLDAVGGVDRKVDAVEKKIDATNLAHDERFQRVEAEVRAHGEQLVAHQTELKDHREQLSSHNTLLREQAQAITTVAGTAARAVEHALAAKQDASRSVDEATKIVESAIKMHSASIASTVTMAVQTAVAPLVKKTTDQDVILANQDKTLASQDIKLDQLLAIGTATASALGNKWLRIFVIVCIGLGALGGSAYAAFTAKQAADAASVKPLPR